MNKPGSNHLNRTLRVDKINYHLILDDLGGIFLFYMKSL